MTGAAGEFEMMLNGEAMDASSKLYFTRNPAPVQTPYLGQPSGKFAISFPIYSLVRGFHAPCIPFPPNQFAHLLVRLWAKCLPTGGFHPQNGKMQRCGNGGPQRKQRADPLRPRDACKTKAKNNRRFRNSTPLPEPTASSPSKTLLL